jgi:HAD superfamily hydrolase (TIGR01509 family)
MQQCVDLITEMRRGAPLPDSFMPQLRLRVAEALKEDIEPIPGVAEMLKTLSTPYCVASSGDHAKIRLTLGATGLLPYFENKIFSVTDVERPKPAPDVFLFAAQQLDSEPSRCAVVEDTPTGVRGAIAAGMHVFGFSANTPEHRLKEAGAHELFSEMRNFPQLL